MAKVTRARGVARERWVTVHPLVVRITHWINAVALVCMVMSGWQIYNASPLLPFVFPPWMTLGGWLAGGIAWHFAAMWLLVVNGSVYVIYGIVGRHFRRSFFPLSARSVWADFRGALSFRLYHTPGVVQRCPESCSTSSCCSSACSLFYRALPCGSPCSSGG